MRRFKVTLARIEHNVYQIEVDAETPDEAEDFALELWTDDDEAFTDLGCVHAEEYIQELEEIKKPCRGGNDASRP